MIKYWQKIATASIPAHISGDLREWHSLANRVTYIAVLYWVIIYGGALFIAAGQIYLQSDLDYLIQVFWLFAPNFFTAALLVSASLYIKLYRSYRMTRENQMRFIYIFLMIVSALLFWASWITPFALPFALLNLPVLLTYIALRESGRFGLSQCITAATVLASGVVGTAKQIIVGSPLVLPDYVIVWGSPLLIFMLILFVCIVVFYLRHEADKTKEYISVERAKSDKLLLNILPTEVAQELKETGKTSPRRYDEVTIIFTDFVGFTKIAERMQPEDLVQELDLCFSYFDSVCEKYNLEKLKTIGDAFMCAGGLPLANKTHAYDAALAALEIRHFMNQMKLQRQQKGLPYWELRLGMHTGPVVAGVVGEKKFAYDIWGDTVNTAARMESAGEPEHINISATTALLLAKFFQLKPRGKIAAKNKGEIEMFFLDRLKTEFAADHEGRVPNFTFEQMTKLEKYG